MNFCHTVTFTKGQAYVMEVRKGLNEPVKFAVMLEMREVATYDTAGEASRVADCISMANGLAPRYTRNPFFQDNTP